MKKRHWMIYAASATLSFGIAASLGCEKEEDKGVLEDAGKQADDALDEASDKLDDLGGD